MVAASGHFGPWPSGQCRPLSCYTERVVLATHVGLPAMYTIALDSGTLFHHSIRRDPLDENRGLVIDSNPTINSAKRLEQMALGVLRSAKQNEGQKMYNLINGAYLPDREDCRAAAHQGPRVG